jgi:glycerophosphoryl diester phosphodiesterase
MATEVIAHRGASGTCPENTLPAFRRAVALGAPMIELDVQLTRDGHPVIIHDWTLERTTSGHGSVRSRTLEEIEALDAGRWFAPAFVGTRVPTLAAVLEAVPVRLNVELKSACDDGLERRVLETVEQAGALGRVIFSSFDPRSLVRLRALSRDAELAVLWAGTSVARAVTLAGRVGARSVHLRKAGRMPAAIAAGHAAGLAVRVWTVNVPADFARLTDAGADGVFTDYPERFLQTRSD